MYHQPNRNPENNPERNCPSNEGTGDTKFYCRKQKKSFHPHTKYSNRDPYINGIHLPTSY